ncbi:hypothetical protein DAPPUDRAFT_236251 [Daphnia pulex]|uniref:Uncharacterized protein n=1 Tax=Daphnia pulex TaxID=6669 RepID=E9G1L1_DAPPU|nr:hypothetical protein DAPPUDRAFT_236251 [Daphnia pulex]|eukprot:EFX86514.1 hypothetical protein DAPPUDRAFT_236251 [Daphnia pulex]
MERVAPRYNKTGLHLVGEFNKRRLDEGTNFIEGNIKQKKQKGKKKVQSSRARFLYREKSNTCPALCRTVNRPTHDNKTPEKPGQGCYTRKCIRISFD